MARIITIVITVATVILVAIGTIWPSRSALAMAGTSVSLLSSSSSPDGAVYSLLNDVAGHNWKGAYDRLNNRAEFTEPEFIEDLTGSHGSLRTYADLHNFDVRPLHTSGDEAQIRAILHWSTVLGEFPDSRDLRVVKSGNHWEVVWPIVKEPRLPPQVIPVNYLRWDVIYRGPGDDWGAQDVDAPHIRVVDMHPIERAGSVIILGELLNEDVVPAFVSVKAALLRKNGSVIGAEDSFEKISHILLPKQVTPFRIDFRGTALSQVDSVHIEPSSNLISASADPVIEIQDQKLNPSPDPSLSGNLLNQSGQTVSIAHVLGTFYDKNGQVVWISDEYVNRALLPQIPVAFSIPLPADMAVKVASSRVVTSSYSTSRFQ